MKILIFCENRDGVHKEAAWQIADELKRRRHEVYLLSVKQEGAPALPRVSLRRRLIQKKRHEAMLCEYAGKLKKQLETDSYDVVIACHIACAEALSVLYRKEEMFLPFMVYVSSGDEPLSYRQVFSCDTYIVRSETEKNTLVRRGVASTLVHLPDSSDHETAQICEIIENEGRQWLELKQMFHVGF